MAFVKVVGGTEIYNFCIQSFVHFSTKFWSKSISNRRSTNYKWVGHTLRRDVARATRRASRPCADRLGIRARTPPKPRAFPRLTPLPEVPRFYPAPRVAPRRLRRTRARPAPGGPPVRPTPRRTRAGRGSTVPRQNPHCHPVVTARRALCLRPPFFLHLTPFTTAPDRSTAPPWPPPPNSPSRASPVPSELPWT
jgi:hypothetical protein